ncbi:MAG: sulfatase-like hydrolase/transferase [Verrucomicrobiota bacterium]
MKIQLLFITLWLTCLGFLPNVSTAKENNPNVVLIFADDLGYGDLSCYGATKVKTPHLDRLAAEGRRFTDAHSASAVCTPSRYALLTGDYPLRKGLSKPVFLKTGLVIDTERQTLADVMKSAGYATACIGKWHLGFGKDAPNWNGELKPGPLELGFDYYYGVPVVNSHPPFVYVENYNVVGLLPDDPFVFGKPAKTREFFEKMGTNQIGGADAAHARYDDEAVGTTLTGKAVKWIKDQGKQPFFLFLSTTNIHHPFTPHPRFKGTSECGPYGDFIHELDWIVGEIMHTLEEQGVADDTLVIFTSDNGGMFNVGGQDAWDAGHRLNGELLGFKFGAWEGGHRVPFIARWPGKIKAGSTSDQLISNIDLIATMASLTGTELKEGQAQDSVDVLAALTGNPEKSVRDHLVLAASKPTHLAIRQGKWIYIPAQGSGGFTAAKRGAHAFGGPAAVTYAGFDNSDIENGTIKADAPPAQLYDLENDLTQTKNLFREHPEVVKDLKTLLESYAPLEKQLDPPSQKGKKGSAANPSISPGAGRPNIIFVLADDLGYSDISCYGAKKVKTPHLDQLAAEGLRFTDFHTAASICSPSRAAFLTGGYPQRAGLYMGINPNRRAHWFLGLHPDEITIAEHLKEQGYATHMVGKWHLGTEPEFLPRTQGFDTYYGMPCNFSHSPKFFDEDEEVFAKTPLDQLTELYTGRVTEIIRKSGDQPFFLYYAHNYPHTPYEASKRFKGSSQDGVRGDIMQEMDWGIGEMMKALEESGQAENTLVIFTSDNGPTKNEYALPYRGTKYVTLEGGHRVPFILHWPAQIKKARVLDTPTHAMDLFPTLSEIVGASIPSNRTYDGLSLVPLFKGQKLARAAKEPFFYYNCENLQAVRMGDWKLHLPRTTEQLPFWEKNKAFGQLEAPLLYNLEKDPGESVDVAENHPDVVTEILELAQIARSELGEYLQRGSAQRPTGSVIPDAPIISHEKDWENLVDPSLSAQIAAEKTKRHPNGGTSAKKRQAKAANQRTKEPKNQGTAEQRPNVLFIFTDDLGYGDLSCYGATHVQTPHIDSLAHDGRRFTDAHSASAVCTPSRYALLTGQYPLRANGGQGVWGPHSSSSGLIIPTDTLTIGKALQQKGYATACLGKWHLGFHEGKNDWSVPLRPGPLDVGFDYYWGLPQVNSGSPFVYVENDTIVGYDPSDPLVLGKKPPSPTPTFPEEASRKSPNRYGGALEAHKIYDDEKTGTYMTKKAVDWITKNKDNPFFLYFSTPNIHHPFTPDPRFKGTSQCGLYGDYIHELDWMVGELLACLEEHELSDNTLVIFTSDNGGMANLAGRHAMKAGHMINGKLLGFKFGAWEGGHRVPFIARWPGTIEAGTESDQLICNVDMLATFMALTGQDPDSLENDKDSVNVLPALLEDPEEPIRKELVLAPSKKSNLSIRQGKWMYIGAQGSGGFRGSQPTDHAWGGPAAIHLAGSINSDIENRQLKADAPPAQLYDLEKDPYQTQNLYSENPEVVAALSARLETFYPAVNRAQPKRRNNKPAPAADPKYDNFEPLGNLRFTFESGKLEGWTIIDGKSGRPISDALSLPRQPHKPYNREGKFHLSTIATTNGVDDKQQVVYQSPPFVIKGNRASFLASGGFHSESLYVALVDPESGQVLAQGGGPNGPQMHRVIWGVSGLVGKTVVLQVVDRNTGGYGHLTFDDFSVDGSLIP